MESLIKITTHSSKKIMIKKRVYTEEGRRRLSLARKGKRLGSANSNWKGGIPKCSICGEMTPKSNYPKRGGRYCQDCYLKKVKIGERTWNWKGGISKTKEYKAHHDRLKRDKRRRNAVGTYTLAEWEALKMKYGYMCLCCKQSEPEISLTRDHVIPLVKGGLNNIYNIQPLCRSCNNRKYTKVTDYRNLSVETFIEI
jgi:hypothetical protein